MAVQVVEGVEESAHPLTRRLHTLLDELADLRAVALGGVDDDASEADRIDPHTGRTTTPTGHSYTARAPGPPRDGGRNRMRPLVR